METPPWIQRARDLRRDSSDPERLLWSRLRAKRLGGWKWRRQESLGPYFADFACPAVRLIVEVDGSQHYGAEAYDAGRTRWLEEQGWRVLRCYTTEVMTNLEGVCAGILTACEERGRECRAVPVPSPAPLRALPSGLASSPKGEGTL